MPRKKGSRNAVAASGCLYRSKKTQKTRFHYHYFDNNGVKRKTSIVVGDDKIAETFEKIQQRKGIPQILQYLKEG